MARHVMPCAVRFKFGFNLFAVVDSEWAPSVKLAARRLIGRRRYFPRQLLRGTPVIRIKRRDRREQRLGIRVARGRKSLRVGADSTKRPRYITAT